MKLVYVAGPYRSALGPWGIYQNIERARIVARELWKMGFAVICPHANTAIFDGYDVSDDVWLAGALVMMKRCDLIVVLNGWESSKGTILEVECATSAGIPVVYWADGMKAIREHA